jgi:hypothetical protein
VRTFGDARHWTQGAQKSDFRDISRGPRGIYVSILHACVGSHEPDRGHDAVQAWSTATR